VTIDVLPGPDTVVLTRRVEPGCEEAFEDVLRGLPTRQCKWRATRVPTS
jgi:hypothetical protein